MSRFRFSSIFFSRFLVFSLFYIFVIIGVRSSTLFFAVRKSIEYLERFCRVPRSIYVFLALMTIDRNRAFAYASRIRELFPVAGAVLDELCGVDRSHTIELLSFGVRDLLRMFELRSQLTCCLVGFSVMLLLLALFVSVLRLIGGATVSPFLFVVVSLGIVYFLDISSFSMLRLSVPSRFETLCFIACLVLLFIGVFILGECPGLILSSLLFFVLTFRHFLDRIRSELSLFSRVRLSFNRLHSGVAPYVWDRYPTLLDVALSTIHEAVIRSGNLEVVPVVFRLINSLLFTVTQIRFLFTIFGLLLMGIGTGLTMSILYMIHVMSSVHLPLTLSFVSPARLFVCTLNSIRIILPVLFFLSGKLMYDEVLGFYMFLPAGLLLLFLR